MKSFTPVSRLQVEIVEQLILEKTLILASMAAPAGLRALLEPRSVDNVAQQTRALTARPIRWISRASIKTRSGLTSPPTRSTTLLDKSLGTDLPNTDVV